MDVNWGLSLAIGFGILLGEVLVRIFNWALGVLSGRGAQAKD